MLSADTKYAALLSIHEIKIVVFGGLEPHSWMIADGSQYHFTSLPKMRVTGRTPILCAMLINYGSGSYYV